jgi:hypothetical protein
MTLNTATVYKASPESPVGIGLRAVNHNVYVSSIADGGLFSTTDLKVGQRVLSINNKNCQGLTSTEAIRLVKSATGSLTILATDEVVATTPTTLKHQAAPEQPKMSHHPNGTKPGGQWGTNRYAGEKTWALAKIGLYCFIPGLLCLCFPMDYREAYKVGGNLYDAEGRLIGPIEQARFIPHPNQKPQASTTTTKPHAQANSTTARPSNPNRVK